MTDGIIQEVFDRNLSDVQTTFADYLIMMKIQRELIEKIKQEWKVINNTHAMCSCNADIEILEMLIGDNQECR